jgi:H+/Cl- antiporter ClcA
VGLNDRARGRDDEQQQQILIRRDEGRVHDLKPPWAKLLFTALTLGAGFLGGEVTPLFFVGAALGNVLAQTLGLPLDLGAGVGLAAVFAAASNTPLALTVMAMELLGPNVFPHVFIVSGLAYFVTGRRSIYPAQRGLASKPWWR